MNDSIPSYHFPADMKLNNPPLAEAWLEIRWQLEQFGPSPDLMRDPAFPFSLGIFYTNIKERFSHRKDLVASAAPQDMLPYVVRHQFRPGENEWPLIQLGPGVATVNFTSPYTWNEFQDLSLYLRSGIVEAYRESGIKTSVVTLRYRNADEFQYGSNNLLDYLRDNLNTSISLPAFIPGYPASSGIPSSANILLTFDLKEPKGTGSLRLVTGTRNQDQAELLVSQFEVSSGGKDVPDIWSGKEFGTWLELAHSVIHEWFFALIEGPLFEKFGVEGE